MRRFSDEQRTVFNFIKGIAHIDDLGHVTAREFELRTREEVLGRILRDHNIIIVAGSFFGDEGKGKMTDALARDPSVVLVGRFNSGENAGHTVIKGGQSYVFHLVPSAIMIEGKTCVIGPECVMDPVNFLRREVSQLERVGLDYRNRFFLGNTHIVGPYHKILDFMVNPSNSSTLQGISFSHISKVWKRSIRLDDLFGPEEGLRAKLKQDLQLYSALLKEMAVQDPEVLQEVNARGLSAGEALQVFDRIYEEKVLARFQSMKEEGKRIPDHLIDFLKAENKVDFLVDLYRKTVSDPLFPQRRDVTKIVQDTLEKGGKILLESPQSYWLSNASEEHFGSSTSAQTHAAGVLASSLTNLSLARVAVINIAKSPGDSRVGRGANPAGFVPQTYFSDRNIHRLEDLGNACMDYDRIQRQYFASLQENGILEPTEFTDETGSYSISEAMAIATSRHRGEKGATTGKPRVTGEFDAVAAYQVQKAQGPYLFISALDRADDQDYFGIVVGYVFHDPQERSVDCNGRVYKNGDIIKIGDQYPGENVLQYCHKIVKTISLVGDEDISANKFNEWGIPKGIQRVLGTIEDLTGFTVIGFGNGSDTNDVQYVRSTR